MTYSERLGDAISYLEAVAIGLRQCKHGELGIRLEEIGRNVLAMSVNAKAVETEPPPDALSPDYSDYPAVLMSYTGQPYSLDED